MTDGIIVALISGGVTLLVCLINNHFEKKKTEQKHAETIQLITYKLDQVTKKVDLHNNAVERLYIVERRIDVDEEKLRVANHRIDDLEHFHKPNHIEG